MDEETARFLWQESLQDIARFQSLQRQTVNEVLLVYGGAIALLKMGLESFPFALVLCLVAPIWLCVLASSTLSRLQCGVKKARERVREAAHRLNVDLQPQSESDQPFTFALHGVLWVGTALVWLWCLRLVMDP